MVKPQTILAYLGGKNTVLNNIIPYFPLHDTYVEPFCGSASVFFAKPPSAKMNVLNDQNGALVNFYEVLKTPDLYAEFLAEIDKTLYSRYHFDKAQAVLAAAPETVDKALRAWAVFVVFNTSYAGKGEDFNFAVRARKSPQFFYGQNSAASIRCESLKRGFN